MAASLLTLFLNMGAQLGFWTILIAHIMFCLSFVVTAVKARVMSMDPRLEQAAQDLYAGPFQTFVRVTLPIAAPGIAAGALLAFALSFDDFIITNFNAGSTVTFPHVRLGIGPARNARSDQRRRYGHVRHRRTVRSGLHGHRQPPKSPQGKRTSAVVHQ